MFWKKKPLPKDPILEKVYDVNVIFKMTDGTIWERLFKTKIAYGYFIGCGWDNFSSFMQEWRAKDWASEGPNSGRMFKYSDLIGMQYELKERVVYVSSDGVYLDKPLTPT